MLVLCISLSACGPLTNTIVGHPIGYDLKNPKFILMPPVLNELSGITYYPKDSSLFGIEDEEGYLYKIFPYHHFDMERWKFGTHGDYEDIVKRDSTFYVLKADGTVYAVVIHGVSDAVSTEYKLPDEGNEFEAMYWDDTLASLVLVCKDCNADRNSTVSTWLFSPETRQFSPGTFQLDSKGVAGLLGERKIKLKPSAAALHPITHKLYVLSSVNKMIVIANRDGSIDAVYNLDEAIYKQPEGIAFAPDGTLYISNEQAHKGSATILMLPYRLNAIK